MNRNVKLEKWQAAQKRHGLSDRHVTMARELGLNPDKLGKIDNHKQESWKAPLPQFIEEIYFRRFKKTDPDMVKSIRELFADEKSEKERLKKAKEQKRKEKTAIQDDEGTSSADSKETKKNVKPVTISQKIKLLDKEPKVRIRLECGDTPETILRKETHIFDEAFDFYEKEKVTLSELGFILKKIHPRYKSRRYGCRTLREIYEKLDNYEVVQTEDADTVIRRKPDHS